MSHYLKTSLLAALFLAPLGAKAWVADDIQTLIQDEARLAQYSGAKLFTLEEGQYIIFAHGVARYDGDFEKSRKLAKADSHAQISKILGSTELSGRTLFVHQEGVDNSSSQKSLTIDQIDTSIFMKSTTNRGYWIDGDSFHLISCIYINKPIPSTAGQLDEEFTDIELDSSWRRVVEQHKELWLGGVGIVTNPEDGQQYLMTLVSVKAGQAPYHESTILQNFANREMTEYINGISVKARSVLTRELQQSTIGDAQELDIAETLRESNTQSSAGKIKAPLPMGTLVHKISKRKFALFVKAVADL